MRGLWLQVTCLVITKSSPSRFNFTDFMANLLRDSDTIGSHLRFIIVCILELNFLNQQIYYIGRRASATPATGSYERHLSNQKNIIRLAIEAKNSEIKALWEGVSLRQYKLPIE